MSSSVGPTTANTQLASGTPIPPEYEFVSTARHKTRVVLGLAVLVPTVLVGLLWGSLKTTGVLILFLVVAAPFLFAAWVLKHQGQKQDEALSKSRQGDYLFFWPFSEEGSDEYRTMLNRRRRRKQLLFMLLPWVLGMVGIAVFGFQQLFSGVQTAHVMKMVTGLTIFVTVIFGGAFALSWIWTIPYRVALNGSQLSALFTNKTILIAGTEISPGEWRRSRNVTQLERDGRTWLKLEFSTVKRTARGPFIQWMVHELPIPQGREAEAEAIAHIYGT